MTNEELIKAQQEDIKTLINTLRLRDKQIACLNNTINDMKYKPSATREYHYGMPYFRIDSYYIRCYALTNVDESRWESGNTYTTYRFHDTFGFRLDNQDFGAKTPGWGGRRTFTTCISYEDLIKKLDRRVRINYKGRGSEYSKLIKDLQATLESNKNWFSEFFDNVSIEEDNDG